MNPCAGTWTGMEQPVSPSHAPQPPDSPIQPLDEHSFDHCIGSASVPVLVEFTAPWCAPCRALEPILQQLAAEGRGRWTIAKVDGDEQPALATRFGIRGFPTLLLFDGGKEVARQLGLTPKQKLLTMLARYARP